MGSFYKWSRFYTHFLLLPQLSEFLKIKQLAKAEGRIQKTVLDHQLFYLFLNFYLSWCLGWLMANKLSSLSASLSLWRHSEIYSRTRSLSNKCLFIFMDVTLSAFQLENWAHLSFANCKVLSSIYPGPNLQTQTPILSSQLGLGMPAPLCKLGLNRPTGQSESSFNHLSFELLNFQISLAPLEENTPGLCHNWKIGGHAGNLDRQHILLQVNIQSHLVSNQAEASQRCVNNAA